VKKFYGAEFGNDFVDMSTNVYATKAKEANWDCITFKFFCSSKSRFHLVKGNPQKERKFCK
jgi:hypothetical protein